MAAVAFEPTQHNNGPTASTEDRRMWLRLAGVISVWVAVALCLVGLATYIGTQLSP